MSESGEGSPYPGKMMVCMQTVYINMNGMTDEVTQSGKKGRVDMLAVTETHLKGWGMD